MSRLVVAAFALAVACAVVAPIFWSSPRWWVATAVLGGGSLACSAVEAARAWRRYRRWEWKP